MGRDEFSCAVFKAVYDARDVWDEMYIATNADAKSAHKTVASPLRLLGEDLGVPVTTLSHSRNCWKSYSLPESLRAQNGEPHPRALLLTASFGKIIPNRILDAFPRYQKLNVHGSLVPALRGPAPVQWAIARGMRETGATVIELSPRGVGIDTGVILGMQKVPIAEDETYTGLRTKLADVGGPLLVRVLRQLLAGTVEPVPQDDAQASHAPAIHAKHVQIDWATWDAAQVERTYRGIGQQKHLTTTIPFGVNGAVKLHDVRVLPHIETPSPFLHAPGECTFDKKLGALRIRCEGGTEIVVSRLQTVNRNATPARDWWNGVQKEALRDGRVLQLGGRDEGVDSGYKSE
ncbi:Formyltransferase [Exidia glandulosa HHB12029]|uniref:Formyltransferase n=1 Tax=Exidia glandulosa HHB12029 TaxID=1314781 RepID=A0A165F0U2_EXIGL|nr:Formyltransferase [Exidia glandulosa HHB12029]